MGLGRCLRSRISPSNIDHGKIRSGPSLRHDAGDRFEVFSAGTKPSHVRPEAIAAMRGLGIDISSHRSKSVDEFVGQPFDYVLTVCDNAKESCPIFLASTKTYITVSRTPPHCREATKSGGRSSAEFAMRSGDTLLLASNHNLNRPC